MGKKKRGLKRLQRKRRRLLKRKCLSPFRPSPVQQLRDIRQAVGVMTRMPPLWLVLVAGSTLTNCLILRFSPLQKPAEAPGDWTLTKLLQVTDTTKVAKVGTPSVRSLSDYILEAENISNRRVSTDQPVSGLSGKAQPIQWVNLGCSIRIVK